MITIMLGVSFFQKFLLEGRLFSKRLYASEYVTQTTWNNGSGIQWILLKDEQEEEEETGTE